jgi:hypothetical protein
MRRILVLSLLAGALAPAMAAAQTDEPMNPLWRQLLSLEPVQEERVSLSADFLYWYMQKLRVPPLVTTGPAGSQAIIGDPGTVILRGDGRLTSRHDRYIGGRWGSEWWLARGSPLGLETSVTILERDSSNITYEWHTITPLALPYVDATTGKWQSYIVAGNSAQYGPLSGSVNVYSRVELFDEDVNSMLRLAEGEQYRVNLLAGAHFLQLRERLRTTGTSRILPAESTLIGVFDQFDTFDKFYGGQIGFKGAWRRGRLVIESKGILALGADAQSVNAKGNRVLDTGFTRTTQDYGLYVLPSNSGVSNHAAFDFVTEWGLNLGFALSSRMTLRLGYTLLTWLNPIRPGDQIEPLNLTQVSAGGLVGPLKPVIPFRTDFYWAQGLNSGFEIRW